MNLSVGTPAICIDGGSVLHICNDQGLKSWFIAVRTFCQKHVASLPANPP